MAPSAPSTSSTRCCSATGRLPITGRPVVKVDGGLSPCSRVSLNSAAISDGADSEMMEVSSVAAVPRSSVAAPLLPGSGSLAASPPGVCTVSSSKTDACSASRSCLGPRPQTLTFSSKLMTSSRGISCDVVFRRYSGFSASADDAEELRIGGQLGEADFLPRAAVTVPPGIADKRRPGPPVGGGRLPFRRPAQAGQAIDQQGAIHIEVRIEGDQPRLLARRSRTGGGPLGGGKGRAVDHAGPA